jgi:hypothetical protein
MSTALTTSTFSTGMSLMRKARISPARSRTSASVRASLTPPALPRPPTRTWALITTGSPISAAARTASSGLAATLPEGTGMP